MHLPELQLNGLTHQQFLDEYWQKKPCLIRQGLPGLSFPLSAEEIAGLSCEEDVPARILQETGGDEGWSMQHGPFTEDDFAALPQTHWTLLVTDLEKHIPELQALIEPFRFIPDWRIDDLMISYAVDQGSVGPHWDEYDVFLIQVDGRREWRVDTRPYTDSDLRPNPDLKILAQFDTEQSWVLEPGDILYLPPNVSHYGIAQGECMTCSVGFRAPAFDDMLASLSEAFLGNPETRQRYADPALETRDNPGQIEQTEIQQVRRKLETLMHLDDASFARWFGEYVTEPSMDWLIPPEQTHDADSLRGLLDTENILYRSTASRLAWTDSHGSLLFFADADSYALPHTVQELVEYLCQSYQYDTDSLQQLMDNHQEAIELLLELLKRGILELDHDAEN
jgi:50S ribosomal protein L16 3-hydroxylase